jgi:hypothetical protein
MNKNRVSPPSVYLAEEMRIFIFMIGMAFLLNDASAITKCIGSDGRVSYTDSACPQSTKNIPLKNEMADSGPKSASEETMCAAHWLKDRAEFENEIGLVDKSDQVIMNGEKLDMVAAYKKPAVSDFNFRKCGKYGYTRQKNLRDFSINQWNAMNSACKLMNPTYLETVKKEIKNIALQAGERAECVSFSARFPNPAALENELRKKSHPTQ